MSSVLVTGSSGFVGAALVDALARRGDRVVGVDLDAAQAAGARPPAAFHRADVRDKSALAAIIARENVDKVVVGAAITADLARERRDPVGVVAVNTAAVAATIAAAAACGVARIVYIGSAAVYGESAFRGGSLSEGETALRPTTLYAITKQAGEAIALRLAGSLGIDLVAVRLGTCFGPFERDTGVRDTLSAPFQLLRIARRQEEARFVRPACRDWLYVRDAVAGIMALLDAGTLPHDVYNVAAGYEWPLTAWCEQLQARYPGFRWALAASEAANVNLFDRADRAPLSIARLCADTGFRPRFDLHRAAEDFLDA